MPVSKTVGAGDWTIGKATTVQRDQLVLAADQDTATGFIQVAGTPNLAFWARHIGGANPAVLTPQFSVASVTGGKIPDNEWLDLTAPFVLPVTGVPVLVPAICFPARFIRMRVVTPAASGVTLDYVIGGSA
jgi:hypothetical protein